MSAKTSDDAFFIGWSGKLPNGLGGFYMAVGGIFIAVFVLIGLALGGNVDNSSRNLFAGVANANAPQAKVEGWQGDQHFDGSLTLRPYPLLHVAGGAGATRSLLLSGYGKRGPEITPGLGKVTAVGGLLKRGDIDMLVMDDPPTAQQGAATPPVAQPVGHWKAAGEICDGKCYPGGMAPGGGLSHRACAVVCLIGEVPPIFVVAEPVAGSTFLLLAGPDGGPMPESLRAYAAKPLELEGDIERLGSILIFRIDPKKARLL